MTAFEVGRPSDGAPAPTAFLPIVTKARELDGRLVLASVLARQGYRVVLGGAGGVNGVASRSAGGLYLSPTLIPAATDRLRALRDSGHRIIAWDEEGLVYPDPDWYFSNRVSAEAANQADAIVAWGQVPADDLLTAVPAIRSPIVPLGNPRIDLLRPPFRRIFTDPVDRIRQRFPRYVLVNTNFDLVNHVDGPEALLGRLRAGGRIDGPADEDQFRRWGLFRQSVFDAFRSGLPALKAALPGIEVVVRPHPSEDPAPWEAVAASTAGIVVQRPVDNVVPWIMGAVAVVHNSCTTAVEAFALDVPAVAFQPGGPESAMESPLPNQLSARAPSWEGAGKVIREMAERGPTDWTTEAQRRTAHRYIAGLVGDPSSQRIANLADELGSRAEIPLPPRLVPSGTELLAGKARSLGRRIRRADRPGVDDARRFGGLAAVEISERLSGIADALEVELQWWQYDRNVFAVEPVG